MMLRQPLCSAVAVALLACGTSGGGGGGGTGTGGTGGGGPGDLVCPAGTTLEQVGAMPVDREGACLDVDVTSMRFLDVCRSGTASPSPHHCLISTTTKEPIWIGGYGAIVPPPGWEVCPEEVGSVPPSPCFVASCEHAPRGSTCSEAATRSALGCGDPRSKWDADCCLRPSCTTDADCGEGEVCREYTPLPDVGCWFEPPPGVAAEDADPDDAESCKCWGGLGSATTSQCFPEDAAPPDEG